MTDYLVIERQTTIASEPSQIAAHIVDFHEWADWSPWEDIDPDLARTYSGPASGVGATYEWSGNRKAGAGRMEIQAITASEIDIALDFTRPFKSKSKAHFTLSPDGDRSVVKWQIHTPKTIMTKIAGVFMNMDKAVGADLEKGLAKLKATVEAAN
jgi:hypothetical protein